MLKRVLAVLVLGIAPAAFAQAVTPSWVGDFEDGTVNAWSERYDAHPGTTDRVTVVNSPVKQGQYALKTTVKYGDLNNAGNRAEVVLRDPMFHQGDEVWFHWYTMFPEDFVADKRWVLFTQWHSSGFGFPITFNLHGEEIDFRVMAHDYDQRGDYEGGILYKAPLERGKWTEYLLHVKFSDSNDGFVELWQDGEQVVPLTYHPTLDKGDYAYLKQGIYRHKEIPHDMTIFHDGMTAYTERPEHLFTPASSEPIAGSPTPTEGGVASGEIPPEGGITSPPGGGTYGGQGCGGASGLPAAALLFPVFGVPGLFRRRRS